MPVDARGRVLHDDGRRYWDGRQWRRTSASLRRRRLVEALLAAVLVGVLAVGSLRLLQAATDHELHGSQVASVLGAIQDLRASWYGTPALWQPPPIAGTDITFFDVSGTTQSEVIDSIDAADICKTHGPCAPDPSAPGSAAWGLEGFRPVGSGYYCYSPSTTTLVFREFILLPRWSPKPDGTVKIPLVIAWNALAMVIYTHESGHVAITKKDLAALNTQAHHLASCDAVNAFWSKSTIYDKMQADQNAYHARLRADCRPEIGCFYEGWMGW